MMFTNFHSPPTPLWNSTLRNQWKKIPSSPPPSSEPVISTPLPSNNGKRPLSDTSSTVTERHSQIDTPAQNKISKRIKKKAKTNSANAKALNKPSDNEDSNVSTDDELPNSNNSDKTKSLKQIFAPLKQNFATKNYPIKSLDNFTILVDMCHKDADIIKVISEFTNDLNGVLHMLDDNYSLVDRSTKIRFTKIANKIREATLPNQQ